MKSHIIFFSFLIVVICNGQDLILISNIGSNIFFDKTTYVPKDEPGRNENNVHYHRKGYEKLGTLIIDFLKKQLK